MRNLTVLGLCLALSACHVTGPRSVSRGRSSYNEVIQRTNAEQLLLNLVRLRYGDTLFFLNVASVASSFTFSANAGAVGAYRFSDPQDSAGGSLGVGFAERPTISYLPLQGESFARQLMTPLDASTLLLLYHSGWSVERVLRLCVAVMGALRNAPSASGPTPQHPPEYARFKRVSHLLRSLQLRGALEMVGVAEHPDEVALQVSEAARQSPEARRLARYLGMSPAQHRVILSPRKRAQEAQDDAYALTVTRSLSAVLFYLAQTVEVPAEHESEGYVTVTRDDKGKRFAWHRVNGDLFAIKTSGSRPDNAYVAVSYRDHWFYVADTDQSSKATFSLLTQLFALKAGQTGSHNAPVLTLPVGS